MLLTLGILFFSCSSNEDENNIKKNNDPLLTKMSYYGFFSEYQNQALVYFEYDKHKRLTKTIGGFLDLQTNLYLYRKDIYTLLTYSNDNTKVTIKSFANTGSSDVLLNSVYIILNKSNQIIEKQIPISSGDAIWLNQKLNFSYSGDKLIEVKTTYPDRVYDPGEEIRMTLEKFYYDENGNLSKAEYFNPYYKEKMIQTFEDYDNSYNPYKRLYLLKDYFYQSLSKNNFQKHTKTFYKNDIMISTSETSWKYSHDSNGNIITY